MKSYRNLVPDVPLVEEAVEMLRARGGSAPATEVALVVLNVPDLDAQLAASLVADLISGDHRLVIRDGATVEINDEARSLREADFVVVDIETTGAKIPPSRIMEIGAYRVHRGAIVSEFQTLVNPENSIPPFIARLTGISNEMVKNAPLFAEIVNDWLDFSEGSVLVAHDAPFDVRFINYEIARLFPGRRMSNPHLCTVQLARSVFPDLPNHRLHTIAEHFQIPLANRHRAAHDARATAEIFLRVLERLDEHGVRDVSAAKRFKARIRSQK
ncbi:MAG: hypothetical protein AUG51_20280 [Acidobacteria bacterium 13_1_20CM_3_53_8]|nr:MAG: hypothetical protein AUG51_20280 [Acidobacteria bacterium 13_1_20CM_3_53_8]